MDNPDAIVDLLKNAGAVGLLGAGILSVTVWAIKKLIATLERIAQETLKQVLDGQAEILRSMRDVLDRLPSTR